MGKDYFNIYALGHCNKCHHTTARNLEVQYDDTSLAPSDCPECGGTKTIHYEKLAVHHAKEDEEKGWRIFRRIMVTILIAIASFVVLTLYVSIRLHRGYTSEEIIEASKIVSKMSTKDMLSSFQAGGIEEPLIAKTLGASIFTIRRLKTGTLPTPAMHAAVSGLYIDYLLLDKSNLLFWWRWNGTKKMDPYYAFPNPMLEKPEIRTNGGFK